MNALPFLVTHLRDLPGHTRLNGHGIHGRHNAESLDVNADAAGPCRGGADHGWPIGAKPALGRGLFGMPVGDKGNQQYQNNYRA